MNNKTMNNENTELNRKDDGMPALGRIVDLPLECLRLHPKNARKTYNNIEELAASIKENGLLQNLVVVPAPDDENTYYIVAGNRRFLGCQKAQLKEVPCRITSIEESEQALMMLTENMQRENLTVYEEAACIQMCIEDYGISVNRIAEKTGLSKATIRHRANIAKLDRKTLIEKTDDENFQITLKDLTALEKLRDIEQRNKVLSQAKNSREISWQVQETLKDEKRKKALDRLIEMAKKAKFKPATEEMLKDIYSSKYSIVLSVNPDGKLPEKLKKTKDEEEYYVIRYGNFNIIRKVKKEHKPLTDAEKQKRAIGKKKRQITEICKTMYQRMDDCVKSILDGKTADVEDAFELITDLWTILLTRNRLITRENLLGLLTDTPYYKLSHEERLALTERLAAIPVHQQMLAAAHISMKGFETTTYGGQYAKETGELLQKFYRCLAIYGFTFSDKAYNEIMAGTHELYEPETVMQSAVSDNDAIKSGTEEIIVPEASDKEEQSKQITEDPVPEEPTETSVPAPTEESVVEVLQGDVVDTESVNNESGTCEVASEAECLELAA